MKQQIKVDEMIFYMGNPNLRGAHVKITYTEDQLKEYIRCSQDPIYFIENYIKIVSLDEGLVPFKMWPFQKKLIQTVIDNRFVITKMSRRSGKTTTNISYLLWRLLFLQHQNLAILANKSKTALATLKALQLAYENIPLWMQQGIIAYNQGNIELENGSKILASSTSADSLRGSGFHVVLLDEFAHVPENIAQEFMTSVYPTIASGQTTKIVITSTPKGMNYFYKLWKDAEDKKNLYVPIHFHWSEVPGRDAAWEEDQIKQLGQDKFDQEFNTSFLGSSATLISPSKLGSIPWEEPISSKHGMCMYEEPKKGRMYTIIVDTARGQGLDYSALSVFDVTSTPYLQVAKYRNRDIPPMLFPNVILNIANYYNQAYVLVENNDAGSQVVDILYHELEYEYIFSTVVMGRGGQKLATGVRKNSRLGAKNSHPVKVLGCGNLKTLIESDQLIIKDFDTICELTTFIANGKSYSAENGKNDDLVITLMLFAWLSLQPVFKEITDGNVRKKILEEKERISNESLLPLGFNSNGEDAKKESFIDKQGNMWELAESVRDANAWWEIPTHMRGDKKPEYF